MINITADHEEIARHIVNAIADDQTHAIQQQTFRRHFTDPYRLHEYDLALKLLKDFDVIRHNNSDRLTPGNSFYTYKTLKSLYKPKIDWKFLVALAIAIFGTATAFYFSYTDRQKSNAIEQLEKTNKELQMTNDSLLKKVIHPDSINSSRIIEKVDTVSIRK